MCTFFDAPLYDQVIQFLITPAWWVDHKTCNSSSSTSKPALYADICWYLYSAQHVDIDGISTRFPNSGIRVLGWATLGPNWCFFQRICWFQVLFVLLHPNTSWKHHQILKYIRNERPPKKSAHSPLILISLALYSVCGQRNRLSRKGKMFVFELSTKW